MAITQEYVSLDGSLRFLVEIDDEGDVLLGFDGFPWHTHADLLAGTSSRSELQAVDQFVQDLLGNIAVIAVSHVDGKVRDIWVSDDPAGESRYLGEGESVELRYWDGRKWGMQVGLVLTTDFGPRLEGLARRMPVWVVDTPANRAVAEMLWGRRDAEFDLTTFQVPADVAAEDWCLSMLHAIDRHHGEDAADSPYDSLVVIGAQLNPDIREALVGLGFEAFAPSPQGFRATRD